MSGSLDSVSPPSRVAERDEGIGMDELLLASRNHAMPMEVLRDDVTPVGLHYVLTHYDIPAVSAEDWRLTIDGRVSRRMKLNFDQLKEMPRHTVRVTLECAGNGRATLSPRPVSQPWLNGAVGTADWTGVPLADLLADADVLPDAVDVVFTGLDHGVERGVEQDYQRGLSLADALRKDVLVAYEMNGAPLPAQHGFPVRLVVPGWYGMAHVKWLTRIKVVDEPFDGYQNLAYRLKQHSDELGEPVTRIEPRALLQPPGFPDFMTRARVLRPGDVTLTGRAWSGWGLLTRVEVSTNDGHSWSETSLGEPAGEWAWRPFTFDWRAEPGEYRLRVRAYDDTGRRQAMEPEWNRGGFTNNADQAIVVLVAPKA
jgi:DMSO/TMAO reductase YedYZ molybdopterin-dependent catalytic subunit